MRYDKENENLRRTYKSGIYLSPEENEIFRSRAAKAGMSPTAYARRRILKEPVRRCAFFRAKNAELIPVFEQLRHNADRLSRIMRYLPAVGTDCGMLREQADQCAELVMDMRDTLTKLGGETDGDTEVVSG